MSADGPSIGDTEEIDARAGEAHMAPARRQTASTRGKRTSDRPYAPPTDPESGFHEMSTTGGPAAGRVLASQPAARASPCPHVSHRRSSFREPYPPTRPRPGRRGPGPGGVRTSPSRRRGRAEREEG